MENASKALIIAGAILLAILLISLGIMIFTLLIKTFYTKKLIYSFSYEIEEKDQFLLLDKEEDNINGLLQMFQIPTEKKKILVVEDDETLDYLEKNKLNFGDLISFNNLSEIDSNLEANQLVFMVVEGKTSRKWYEDQRRFNLLLSLPVLVIQINQL